MKKFAFLVHLRDNYRKDLGELASPLGLVPDPVYRFLLKNRPLKPFVWSNVTLTPGAKEPEGFVIMLPYSGRQLLEQQKLMLPLVMRGMELAKQKGAEIMGLGALTSPITLGGKLVANNPFVSVTNGNAFTAVITHERIKQLIGSCPNKRPVVALVGATGSVGTLVSLLLAKHNAGNNYLLVARNENRLKALANKMNAFENDSTVSISQNIDSIKSADIVVLLTTAADCLLKANQLKRNAIVLDDTQPRNTHPDLLVQRPDIRIIDGGLVSVTHLNCTRGGIGLPQGLSYACMAETMLLAMADYEGDFSIGNPGTEQAEFISTIAAQFGDLGFCVAPDHSFGQPVRNPLNLDALRQTFEIVTDK
ncbi:shikimate dehydrogenase [Dyadobacter pollutisoli]|jgi:predicted amino acid dehydrogenase|uniref:Shikimate dehydrogenase n=1 Tax=Dyadobacter pollutisoli TaxID=2910158 RepID=A0A9E8SLS5_9BACT|nr:shikimate dehydrogenase [Dyadobacter pollutisoli]WAC12076.1 shikimate dehydrogenase [Dyadobacter pollutisoli]